MKILLVTNYQPPHMGGIEYAAGSLKRCWQDAGHQVTWMTTDIPRDGAPKTADNIRVSAANFFEDWWQINSPVVSPFAWGEIKRQVAAHDAINIHSLAPGLSTLALKAAIAARKPTVITQHVGVIPLSMKFLSTLQERFLCELAHWSVKRGARLTFVGQAVRDWFAENARLNRDPLVMTPAGIDQHSFHFVDDAERAALRKKWEVDDRRLHVLFVGRFYEKKGLPLLRQVAMRCPDVLFTLVGSGPIDPDSWNLDNLRRIRFVSTEELRELYGCHDLFIMPSVGEGWPAVVPQAMASGLACMISEETFLGYNKDPDRFLICARDADVIAGLLDQAANGKVPLIGQRRELAEFAARTWDWRTTAAIYIDLFRQRPPL